MSEFIGPALPPHLKRRVQTSLDESRESDKATGSRREKNDSVIELSHIPLTSKVRSSTDSVDDVLVCSAKEESEIGPLLPCHHSSQSSGESSEDNSESDSDSTIGPLLPPHLITKSSHCSQEQTCEIQADIGPSLPPHLRSKLSHHSDKDESADSLPLGPSLPPHPSPKLPGSKQGGCGDDNTSSVQDLRRESEEDDGSILVLTANSSDEDFCEDKVYGPALPPGLKTPATIGSRPSPRFKGAPLKVAGPALPPGILGPSLPPGFKASEASPGTETLNLTQPLGGLEHGNSSESEDDVVGPVPEGCNNFIQEQLEMRAMQMRRNFAGDDKSSDDGVPKRESWMLELPPERAAEFGLGPRQFRARARLDPGDRTVWTDTPEDRERKKHCKVEVDDSSSEKLKQRALKFRDMSMQQEADRHANKREEKSLLDSHQELLKKKRKKDKESGKQLERRPFDRDTDLHTNRFDEAQKKSIYNKARLLNDRFSSGQSKFL